MTALSWLQHGYCNSCFAINWSRGKWWVWRQLCHQKTLPARFYKPMSPLSLGRKRASKLHCQLSEHHLLARTAGTSRCTLSVERNYFLHETAHNEVCGWSWFLESDVAVEFKKIYFGVSRMPHSHIIIIILERKRTFLEPTHFYFKVNCPFQTNKLLH